MKTAYYFDNTEWTFSKNFVVITEKAWRKAMDNNTNCALTHHWISTYADDLDSAKARFTSWVNE